MQAASLNVISLILFTALVVITRLLIDMNIAGPEFTISFLLMIPYLILHEILHSISYCLNGADFKNITYGAHLEKGVLCCLCKQNITKRNILISLVTPLVVIGVITYIIGIITNNLILVYLSIINISGCSGDIMMFASLLKLKNFEYSEYDNPMAFGIYTSEDLSKKKLLGLKYIGTENALKKENMKKISISKISIIFFIIYILLCLVYIALEHSL